jgi:hypothetical protein
MAILVLTQGCQPIAPPVQVDIRYTSHNIPEINIPIDNIPENNIPENNIKEIEHA